jgi:hypothetical protein
MQVPTAAHTLALANLTCNVHLIGCRGNWSFEEEFLLAQCHAVVGSHWSKMTKRLPGRTENSIKNFWNATLRSKYAHNNSSR